MQIKNYFSGSSGNLYAINDGKTKILIECGVTISKIKKALKYKLSDVDGCLVSHAHFDHSKAMKDLMQHEIECYCLQDVKDALNLQHHRLNVFEFRKQFTIGSFTILPFELVHCHTDGTPCPNAGFLIVSREEKLIYITDTAYSRYYFKGLTHIMLEANYDADILDENIKDGLVPALMRERLLSSHLSIDNAIELLKMNDLSQVKSVHLIHLSKENASPEIFSRKIQNLFGIPTYVF